MMTQGDQRRRPKAAKRHPAKGKQVGGGSGGAGRGGATVGIPREAEVAGCHRQGEEVVDPKTPRKGSTLGLAAGRRWNAGTGRRRGHRRGGSVDEATEASRSRSRGRRPRLPEVSPDDRLEGESGGGHGSQGWRRAQI
jgi:hypothetical protein